MSAEVENNKEEETKEQQNFKQKAQKHWQIGTKILELLLCIICIGTVFDALKTMGIGNSDLHHIGIMYTAYTGYILITLTLLTSYYLEATIPYKTSALFSVCGAGLFLTTGVLLIVDRSAYMRRYGSPISSQLTMIVVSVIFAFVNAIVFAVDAVLTVRRQEDF
ncbi:uncharacterized protein LOC103314051 isoform X1 [Tribolium castaneum]|uniref:uncharacterized protein LOC103314051 isoform X1 n=1 Tax=Tribolium castaneum TaxID=7070 RepID=UPI00046C2A47|nr:PREDICTED: uncharacterized protein LOC103314051 isoform X1 [Tribolium castaneum]XP_015838226.1 PREDICTED: uncharacterized protein LOC103314051 isoform X1 [Tribolium castaneum]|eukprot:XP_008197067.1 PREDICTED: uncharacterized protein LOC103314051 isoform X1 [Tribolium castaneum]